MKKILKYISLIILLSIILISLTGCGNNTIIATKDSSDDNLGKYSQRVEIIFDGDIISEINIMITFYEESVIKLMEQSLKDVDVDFTIEGNTAYFKLDSEEYKKMYKDDFSTMSKEEIKAKFEEDGFLIEKK